MPKTKYSPEQIQQMRDWRLNEKKSPKEIIQLFKEKFQLDLQGWEVSYYCKPAEPKKRKSKVGGGTPEKETLPGNQNEIKSLVDKLFAELEAYNAFVIKKIRVELVRRIGEARQKRIDAGEEVEETEVEEVKA